MITRNECLDAALDELRAAGVTTPTIARGSKHLQVRWFNRCGESRMMPVPGSPSDVRSPANMRRAVRRVLRTDGMLAEQPTRPPPARQLSRLELLERRVMALEQRLQGGST